jgi:hypothetical protein
MELWSRAVHIANRWHCRCCRFVMAKGDSAPEKKSASVIGRFRRLDKAPSVISFVCSPSCVNVDWLVGCVGCVPSVKQTNANART